MASLQNDRLLARTIEGSLNYYDNHRGCATAGDKGLASRLGGHNYNIINNTEKTEIYFRDLRHGDHYVDPNGKHTVHWFGCRKRHFTPTKNSGIKEILQHPHVHPREHALAQRRAELQLAQAENPTSYRNFFERSQASFPPEAQKRYSLDSKKYGSEMEHQNPRVSEKPPWQQRRGQEVSHSSSAPTLSRTAPNLTQAMRDDPRKEASQRQAQSSIVENSARGRSQTSQPRSLSLNRVENYDFAVTKKNNHFSQKDKLTRADDYFTRPRLTCTNNSVKYDIVTNERKWFAY